MFFLIWNTALQEKWKSTYIHYFSSSYTERLSEVARSNFDLLHFFMLFLFLVYSRPVKIFSLSYANLFCYCFVSNYWKVFIVLKLYFTKVFGRCPQLIIIDDVLLTSENFNQLKEVIYFKIQSAGVSLFVTQRRSINNTLSHILFQKLLALQFSWDICHT